MLSWLAKGESGARKKVLAMLPKDAAGAEIGVWKGDFSAQLLSATKPRILHLVDPWLVSDAADRADAAWYGADKITQAAMDSIHDQVSARFAQERAKGSVAIHRADARAALGAMAEDSLDYVYVDGDHSYEGVSTDLAEAFRVTKVGGYLCCDDYLLGAWWQDGVVRAVHELLVSKPVVIEFKANTQVVLRKLATPLG
ncbi:MAG: class I SAM-dependent methyltransferase [Sphingomonadaceae bacterium]